MKDYFWLLRLASLRGVFVGPKESVVPSHSSWVEGNLVHPTNARPCCCLSAVFIFAGLPLRALCRGECIWLHMSYIYMPTVHTQRSRVRRFIVSLDKCMCGPLLGFFQYPPHLCLLLFRTISVRSRGMELRRYSGFVHCISGSHICDNHAVVCCLSGPSLGKTLRCCCSLHDWIL